MTTESVSTETTAPTVLSEHEKITKIKSFDLNKKLARLEADCRRLPKSIAFWKNPLQVEQQFREFANSCKAIRELLLTAKMYEVSAGDSGVDLHGLASRYKHVLRAAGMKYVTCFPGSESIFAGVSWSTEREKRNQVASGMFEERPPLTPPSVVATKIEKEKKSKTLSFEPDLNYQAEYRDAIQRFSTAVCLKLKSKRDEEELDKTGVQLAEALSAGYAGLIKKGKSSVSNSLLTEIRQNYEKDKKAASKKSGSSFTADAAEIEKKIHLSLFNTLIELTKILKEDAIKIGSRFYGSKNYKQKFLKFLQNGIYEFMDKMNKMFDSAPEIFHLRKNVPENENYNTVLRQFFNEYQALAAFCPKSKKKSPLLRYISQELSKPQTDKASEYSRSPSEHHSQDESSRHDEKSRTPSPPPLETSESKRYAFHIAKTDAELLTKFKTNWSTPASAPSVPQLQATEGLALDSQKEERSVEVNESSEQLPATVPV